MTSNIVEQFRAFIMSICDTDPGVIIADGRWHRFRVSNTRHKGSKPGAYLLHADGKANGIFVDWRDGERHKWFADGPVEHIDRSEIDRRRKERQAEIRRGLEEASAKALSFWRTCDPSPKGSHRYLDDKKIAGRFGIARVGNHPAFGLGPDPLLIIPIRNVEAKLATLQAIRGDGQRRFFSGTTHEGGFTILGNIEQGIIGLCEGFATGVTIHEATGWAVIVCVTSGNMERIARWAGHAYAGREFVVCGDDDVHLEGKPSGNVGRMKAKQAARILGGRLAFPDLQGADGSDFNDQAGHYGVADVSATLAAALDEPAEPLAGDTGASTPALPDPPGKTTMPDAQPGGAATDQLALLPGRADTASWIGKQPPARRFIIPGWVIRGAAALLSGQEGVGKSLLAQQMATCAAAGQRFLGLEIEHVNAIYVSCEDPIDEMWLRQEAINRALGIRMDQIVGRLELVSLKGQLGNELGTFSSAGILSPGARYQQIKALALESGARLIFLDNAAHFFTGDENRRHDVAAFLGLIENLAEAIDGAAILLAHPNKQHAQGNKQGNEYSGSTGWSAHVRSRLFLDWKNKTEDGEPLDGDERILRKSKANYGKKGEEIDFRWHQWAFIQPNDLGPSTAAKIARVAVESSENERYLACLDVLTAQKRATSHSAFGANYAPKVMAKMTEAGGITKAQFERAQERLFSIGAIEANAVLWLKPNRHPQIGIGRKVVRQGASDLEKNPMKSMRQTLRQTCAEPRHGSEEIEQNQASEFASVSPLYIHIPPDAALGGAASGDQDREDGDSDAPPEIAADRAARS